MKKLFFILFFFLGIYFNSKGQATAYKLPVYFGQFYNDPFLSSENLFDDKKGFGNIGHRRNSDNFGNVNTSFAAFQYKLEPQKNQGFNEVGLHFFNDNEGPLLNTTRAYLNYTRNIQLNDDYNFAGGISFGFYNYAIKSDGTNEGNSEITFDGSAVVKLYSRKTAYSFIINQAYNSSIQPFQEKRILIRNLNLFWNRDFVINDYFKSINNIILRWSKVSEVNPQTGLHMAFNSQLLISNIVLVGATVLPKTGNYYSLGMNEIPGLGSKIGFEISYLTPTDRSVTTNLNQFEITLNYTFSKGKTRNSKKSDED